MNKCAFEIAEIQERRTPDLSQWFDLWAAINVLCFTKIIKKNHELLPMPAANTRKCQDETEVKCFFCKRTLLVIGRTTYNFTHLSVFEKETEVCSNYLPCSIEIRTKKWNQTLKTQRKIQNTTCREKIFDLRHYAIILTILW